MKWGEYASDVQLILRRSNSDGKQIQPTRTFGNSRNNGMPGSTFDSLTNNRTHDNSQNGSNTTSESHDSPEVLKRNRDIRKSLTFSGLHGTISDNSNSELQMENIAVVQPTLQSKIKDIHTRNKNIQKPIESPTRMSSNNEAIQKTKMRDAPPYRDPPGPDSSSPLRTLPPYRDPPPPIVTSPGRSSQQSQEINSTNDNNYYLAKDESLATNNTIKSKRNQTQELQSVKTQINQPHNMVTVAYTQRYAELIRLVNKQRDTINAQQVDLTKLDAEILYWENKNREHFNQMDFISQEINRIETNGRVIEDQINDLMHTEEESEIVRQQEKTLKSEITLLRSKLANCETELLQCKNKIRFVR